jgi:hypothetical protein
MGGMERSAVNACSSWYQRRFVEQIPNYASINLKTNFNLLIRLRVFSF